MHNIFQYTFQQTACLGIIILLLFVEYVDANILNIAIPQIALEFHSNIFILKFAITSYIIGLSIFIPVSNWFADNLGIKKNSYFLYQFIFIIFYLLRTF